MKNIITLLTALIPVALLAGSLKLEGDVMAGSRSVWSNDARITGLTVTQVNLTDATNTLNTATNRIQAQIGTLNDATNKLNTATNALQSQVATLNDATNTLNIATNGIQVQIGTLNDATNTLNIATNALQIQITAGGAVGGVTNRMGIGASPSNDVMLYIQTNAPYKTAVGLRVWNAGGNSSNCAVIMVGAGSDGSNSAALYYGDDDDIGGGGVYSQMGLAYFDGGTFSRKLTWNEQANYWYFWDQDVQRVKTLTCTTLYATASSLGSVTTATLRITGGSPTIGAVWTATNNAGQGTWRTPVMFRATISGDVGFSNGTDIVIGWDTEDSDYGSCFDGTTFTAPVAGIYEFVFEGRWSRVTGSGTYAWHKIFVNTDFKSIYFSPYDTGRTYGNANTSTGFIYLTNGSPVTITVGGEAGSTNKLVAARCTFSGCLIHEVP